MRRGRFRRDVNERGGIEKRDGKIKGEGEEE